MEKFSEMKERNAQFGGKTEMSCKILHEIYERLLYKEVVLEVLVSYTSGVQANKVNYTCNGVNWGRRIDWSAVNKSLLRRMSAYRSQHDFMNQFMGDGCCPEEEEPAEFDGIITDYYGE